MLDHRRLLANGMLRETVCRLAAIYIRLVWRLGRWTIENEEVVGRFLADKRPFIACFWHGRLLMMPCAWSYPERMHIVISRHRDGRLISRTLDHLGIATIAGSSSEGGHAALRGMLDALARREYVGVTPDGPRGPGMRATAGVVRAARIAGVPLVPVTYAAARRRVLDTWDRFVLPLPLSSGVIRIGAPIDVPAGAGAAEIERIRGHLETTLNDMTRDLDARYGFAPAAMEAPVDVSAHPRRAKAG
jgi:hypothetical protein